MQPVDDLYRRDSELLSNQVIGSGAEFARLQKSPSAAGRIFFRTLRVLRSTQPSELLVKRSFQFGLIAAIGVTAFLFLPSFGDNSTGGYVASLTSKAGFGATQLVVNGNSHLDVGAIRQRLAGQLGGSLFSFNADAARQQIISSPWIKHAEVLKIYPDTVVIDLTERKPVALWKADGVVNIISKEGHVIGEAELAHMRLPQVVGQGANKHAAEFLSFINRFSTITSNAKAYVRVGDRRWNIHMDDGPNILLPENNWKSALVDLATLQRDKGLLDRDIVQVDMRLPDRLVVKLPSEQAKIRRTTIEEALKKKWHKI